MSVLYKLHQILLCYQFGNA